MKKIPIKCTTQNGGTVEHDIYIEKPRAGSNPVQFQQSFLSKEKGINIPKDVIESLAKLLEIAEKHGVSFEDLCVYSIEAAKQQQTEKNSEKDEKSV
ncbi:MAG: DUF2610 domain-containing protein [Alphaproteobacteria bacterium]|jgi:hypothetical protein